MYFLALLVSLGQFVSDIGMFNSIVKNGYINVQDLVSGADQVFQFTPKFTGTNNKAASCDAARISLFCPYNRSAIDGATGKTKIKSSAKI